MTLKNKAISELFEKLKANKIDYPLALVGSATTKSEFNDLDLLMVVDEKNKAEQLLLECFKNEKIKLVDDAIKILDYLDIEISIALYTKENIEEIIGNFLSGKGNIPTHRTWSIGYWICESFIDNLSKMEIINDKHDFLKIMQALTQKKSPYAKRKIISECIEEIELKKELIQKYEVGSLEYNILKNDLVLSIIRGIYTNNNQYISGFKRLTTLVDNCQEPIRKEILKYIKDGSIESIVYILSILKESIRWNNTIYLGTWQYGGGFKNLSNEEIENLLEYAKMKGIKKFDTALVYGKGNVEKILSLVVTDKEEVLTKIPAKNKPGNDNNSIITNFYSFEYMKECVNKSLKNLNKEKIDICLLHNWAVEWNNHFEIIEWLLQLKRENLINRIGISLPNGYDNALSDKILSFIDVIEAPYNPENTWIEKYIEEYKKYGIEIILRSLFLQGKILKNNNDLVENIIKKSMEKDTSLVIGMTTFDQIDRNVKVLEKKYE